MFDEFWQETVEALPTLTQFLRVGFRLTLAAGLGALPGLQRERAHQAAGLRTHMLVALGSAIFTLGPQEAGLSLTDSSRVIQGIATGIGFVGAGAILKMSDQGRIHGLTTAASIWATAGIGMSVGLGRIWLPALGSLLALLILAGVRKLETHGDLPTQGG